MLCPRSSPTPHQTVQAVFPHTAFRVPFMRLAFGFHAALQAALRGRLQSPYRVSSCSFS